ncbi:hypothetical protein BDW72DRAFT_164060 [Aspergillus terricola var. indicus]
MSPRYTVADSDSESEPDQSATPPHPSDKELEKALRETVAKIFKTGKMEELTVKRVRLAAEKTLEIEEGFFRSNGDWKARSDTIIKDEVEVQDAAAQNSDVDEGGDESAKTSLSKPTKRAEPMAPSTSRKRRKTSTESDRNSEVDDEDTEGVTTAKTKSKTMPKAESSLAEGKAVDMTNASNENTKSSKLSAETASDSESGMSSVLDEEPQPKRQRQKRSTGVTSAKGKKKAPTKSKDADVDPNQAEIKRLQGWLIKCGVRKMWARELAPYDTPKAKIKHLKDMLKDVGMEGRYSLEKARQIKEERELREDLEMVQEGAKRWGKDTANDDSDSGRRRRLNRGRKALAFLESDGEETD